jgi:2'-5' RNA ligase
MTKRAVVYWLVPAKAERALLQAFIRILAKQRDAPGFEPHLTVFEPRAERRLPKQVLKLIKSEPITLAVKGVGFSSPFAKTLFVRLQSNGLLKNLVGDMQSATESRGTTKRFEPHLSLLYQRMSAVEKKELAAAIKLPFRKIVFDSMKAVRCASPTTTAAEVKGWKVLATKKLTC